MTARLGSRDLFPTLEARAYLNHAAISPFSRPVHEAVGGLSAAVAARGLGALSDAIDRKERARQAFAELIGADAADVALVHNTTEGVRAIAFGIDWSPGDRIVGFEGEFPANVVPWMQAARTFDVGLELVPLYDQSPPTFDGAWHQRLLARVEAALSTGRCRVLAVSAVQFDTGVRMPLHALSALCRAHGALLVVDAIQACGAVPLRVDELDADFVACGGHKFLMGAEGAGFLWARPDAAAALVPRLAGWMSFEEPFDFLFGGDARLRYDKPLRGAIDVFEGAANNGLGYAAASESLPLLNQLGVDAIFAHVQAWHDRMEPHLHELGFTVLRAPSSPNSELRSANLASIPPAGTDLAAIARRLGEAGVAASTPNGHLRFAPHWPNGLDEPDLVADALRDVLRGA